MTPNPKGVDNEVGRSKEQSKRKFKPSFIYPNGQGPHP